MRAELVEADRKTVALLKNLIVNIEDENVTTLHSDVAVVGGDIAVVNLVLRGEPLYGFVGHL